MKQLLHKHQTAGQNMMQVLRAETPKHSQHSPSFFTTSICPGRNEETVVQTGVKNRELIVDPTTGSAFCFSTDQTCRGRPEFLFLDLPANINVLLGCSKIIDNYAESQTTPTDFRVVVERPFGKEGDTTCYSFVARVLMDSDSTASSLKRMLEQNYLYHTPARFGLVVMIPLVGQADWQRGNHVAVPQECTKMALDGWVRTVAIQTGAYNGRFYEQVMHNINELMIIQEDEDGENITFTKPPLVTAGCNSNVVVCADRQGIEEGDSFMGEAVVGSPQAIQDCQEAVNCTKTSQDSGDCKGKFYEQLMHNINELMIIQEDEDGDNISFAKPPPVTAGCNSNVVVCADHQGIEEGDSFMGEAVVGSPQAIQDCQEAVNCTKTSQESGDYKGKFYEQLMHNINELMIIQEDEDGENITFAKPPMVTAGCNSNVVVCADHQGIEEGDSFMGEAVVGSPQAIQDCQEALNCTKTSQESGDYKGKFYEQLMHNINELMIIQEDEDGDNITFAKPPMVTAGCNSNVVVCADHQGIEEGDSFMGEAVVGSPQAIQDLSALSGFDQALALDKLGESLSPHQHHVSSDSSCISLLDAADFAPVMSRKRLCV